MPDPILSLRSFLPARSFGAELEAAAARPEEFDDRNGYLPDFLGADPALLAPFPLLADESDLVPVSRARPGRPFELLYHNFSVAMCRSRKLCCVTAVNIDGSAPFFRPQRPGWKTDARIPEEFQVDGPEFYGPTTFDRGHMVRRLDPVWGEESVALQANKDTHHYTNACPQVHSFNDGTWGDLEDWILSQGQTRGNKASVFTGPILRPDDPIHHGLRVPVRFYKMVAVVHDATGQLSVTAFRMDQSAVLPPPEPSPLAPARFDPGAFVLDQITVAEVQEASGLDLGRLVDFDVLAQQPIPPAERAGGPVHLPLSSVRDAVIWVP